MAVIICLAGAAGEDKERLISSLAAELGRRGLKVGLIRAEEQAADRPAVAELRVGPSSLGLRRALEAPLSLDEMAGLYMDGVDLVISEVHLEAKRAKIELVAPGGTPTLLGDPNLRALVGAPAGEHGLPVFAAEDLAGLAGFMMEMIPERGQPPKVRIMLAGKRVPAKGFIQDMVAGTTRSMISSLKGGDRPGRLVVIVE